MVCAALPYYYIYCVNIDLPYFFYHFYYLISVASLGEHRIREMNDEINKMMRQKHHWEVRIRELGGEAQRGRQFIDIEGKELPGAPGYKYYGAAKELPGVRELFAEKDDDHQTKRSKRYDSTTIALLYY